MLALVFSKRKSLYNHFMQHQMQVSSVPFEKIRNGRKVIESRLYDAKRQAINLDDEILFSQQDSDIRIATKVIGILRYSYFYQLFADHDPKLFGGENEDELLKEIKQFYSDEDEVKYGVVGIRFQKLG